MPPSERGSLKAAFAGFKQSTDDQAEIKLLGRTVSDPNLKHDVPPVQEPKAATQAKPDSSYQVATSLPASISEPHHAGSLIPRPLRQREAVRQLSFRCPVSIAAELRRKAAFNQLEQQEIIVEGLMRVLAELEPPPAGWESGL